jgi:predicted alpha/beta superfamily hydrolase
MKTYCLTTMIAVTMLFCSNGIQAQTTQTKLDQVCLDNTEQFSIVSKYVKDETYVIQVGLPFGYFSSHKSYPVLYFADGDIGFGMIKGIVDLLMLGKEIKDIIVIGISYGQGMDAWWNKRARDLTPSKDTMFGKQFLNGEQFLNAGGADNFLKFIQYELFPAVNKNYRTNPDSNAISGSSFGGLLNSYILFKQPELFKGYIINEPSLGWDNKSILKLETEYFSNHTELNNTVYMAYGSLDNKEAIINPTNELIQMLLMHNYKGLRLVTRIFEGETHYSLPSTAITNGLKTLFNQ